MKCLYFLLFLAVAQGFVLNERTTLPVPYLKSLTALNPPAIAVEWNVVTSLDKDDPVLGYKVWIWEVPTIKKYKLVDGEIVLVGEKLVEMDLYKPLETTPWLVQVVGGDKDKVVVNDVEVGTTYQIRVRAYSKKMDGPLSLPMRVKIE